MPGKKPRSRPARAPTPAGAAAATLEVLLPYQKAWVQDPAQVKVWEKSRRIGASWTEACDAALTAMPATGEDVLYIGYSEDMTREFIDDCAHWSRHFQEALKPMGEVAYEDEGKSIKAFRLDFASGKKILALSSRPRSIRGKQGKVVIDEAAFHDDLPGLLKAALAMLIWGGRVAILSSHNGEDNPFNILIKEIRAGKLRYSLKRTTFDDALADGLFDRVKMIMGKRLGYELDDGAFHEIAAADEWREWIFGKYGDGAAEELLCIPRAGSGVYIPRTIVERCQRDGLPVIRLAKPAEWMLDGNRLSQARTWIADVLKPAIDSLPMLRTVKGRDFGRSGDLSVDSILQEYSPGKWRATLTLELRRIPFDVQQLIDSFLLENLPLFHHAKYDARGNGQQLAEASLQKLGPARIECVMASPSWYAANFPPYKAALEDQSCELPRGEDEIADHRRVILKNGYPAMDDGRDKGSDGEYRHGDRAVARVLAWAATRQEGEPPAGESVLAKPDTYQPAAMAGRRRVTMFKRAA